MERTEKASKAYDIHVSLEGKEVPDFEFLPKVGMMVSLSLHIRGLPVMEYDKLRQVSGYYFGIPSSTFREIIVSLAEIEFVQLISEKATIKKVIPQVPFFDNVYDRIGEYVEVKRNFNEQEELALAILTKLSKSPTEKSVIYSSGAEKKIIDRSLKIGLDGGYVLSKRARGQDILITPVFFSENADIFADMTAKAGAKKIKRLLDLIKKS